ncbi:hypothetical protein HHI36_000694 [Cryptolaemus montrouzieri]|uniref:Carboxylic ester hydrolase n=1 Tax=Cryptolaemus montrouzieri TaxID=559131 RepID=A0ABD2P5A7_9CUCU
MKINCCIYSIGFFVSFQAPKVAEPWSGEFDATKEGPECPSAHLLFLTYIGKEDNCLNLSVYTKELPEPDAPPKPVMVWIHGGGFIQGSNKTEFYSPDYLMTEDVIQVIINYRLGIFGFLCLEDENLEVPGNAGLKDQVHALKWVRDNIASFGGDPNNVTIYGESAGSASVHYLILSPSAKGLFHKAILQSGCTLNVWACGQRGTADITKRLGIKETEEKMILEQLQKTCPKKLVSAQMKAPELMVAAHKRIYGPVVEKPSEEAFLTEDPITILKSGNYNKVPMIIGLNTNEGLLYEIAKKTRNIKGPLDLELEIPHELGISPKTEAAAAIADKIKKFYKLQEGSNDDKTKATYILKSDHHFNHGVHRCIIYHLESNTNPMYYYLFSFDGDFNYFKKFATSKALVIYFICHYFMSSFDKESIRNMFIRVANSIGFRKLDGVCHADDIGYLFRSFFSKKVDPESREAKMVKQFVTLWTNFAKYGNPTPENKENELGVRWQPLEKQKHHCLNIGDELKMESNPFEENNKFWDEIYKEYLKN